MDKLDIQALNDLIRFLVDSVKQAGGSIQQDWPTIAAEMVHVARMECLMLLIAAGCCWTVTILIAAVGLKNDWEGFCVIATFAGVAALVMTITALCGGLGPVFGPRAWLLEHLISLVRIKA